MVSSEAKTVDAYLNSLPVDKRTVIETVRKWILVHLPSGYEEQMRWGMLSYEVPLALYPRTYNGQPLSYAGLAAQKSHFSLYLMSIYQDVTAEKELISAYQAAGLKLKMGKACIRFRRLDELLLEALVPIVARYTPAAFIAVHEANRKRGIH